MGDYSIDSKNNYKLQVSCNATKFTSTMIKSLIASRTLLLAAVSACLAQACVHNSFFDCDICVADAAKLLTAHLERLGLSQYLETCLDNGVTMEWINESCADRNGKESITLDHLVKWRGIPKADAKRILKMRRRLAETSPAGSTQPRVASTIEGAVLVFLIVAILFLIYVFASPLAPKRD